MRSRRYPRSWTTGSDEGPSSEPDHVVHDSLEQTVDSRAYSFAYLIQEPSQLPAGFPVRRDFKYALFLPQELVPRFETPRYVPRLLLEASDCLSVLSHPRCGPSETTIRLVDISYIELERFMADCSLIVFTPDRVVHLPFHGRDREYVATFLNHLKHRLRSGGERSTLISERPHFGSKLDYKFKQIEAILNVDPEEVVARFFVPPKEVTESRFLRQEFSWTFGSEIVLTRSELHLFSDDKDGYRELYGFRASWVPLQNVADIRWDDAFRSITTRLSGGLSLKVPVPDVLRTEANRFVRFALRRISSSKAN
jgi:hypothetical protein